MRTTGLSHDPRGGGHYAPPSGPERSTVSNGGRAIDGTGVQSEMSADERRRGHRILVVDDAPETRLLLVRALERDGFVVDQAEDGLAALAAIEAHPPNLVLLDVNMPGMSGFEVLSDLRRTRAIPIILLTGRDEETDRVIGLELGADDYVVKPFSLRELSARIRSVLRRAQPVAPAAKSLLEFGSLVIRLAEREVLVDGRVVDVTPKEFDLLSFLAASPRQVFSRTQLLENVWGSSSEWQDPATVTEHVRRLRKKIEPDPDRPRWLATARGVGYRFEP
jgi:DNA-binding response OmpR family regulator